MDKEKETKENDMKYIVEIKKWETIFWLGFWFLLIGGCTIVEIWDK